MFVTANTEEHAELVRELADALASVDLDASVADGDLLVDGRRFAVDLIDRAHPTPADLAHLSTTETSPSPVVVVADRISEPGRAELRRAGWGWLDRRGHLRLWAPGVRIESPLPDAAPSPSNRSAGPWTTVGLELALASLIHPDQPVTARRFAPMIDRSVGAVQALVNRFSEVGLVGPSTRLPLLPELFWETAAHWPDDGWLALAAPLESVAERLGGAHLWRVDERAATLGGARIPAAGDLAARAYLDSPSGLRRVRTLVDRKAPTRTWVRLAPITYLPENEAHPASDVHPWRVAHPLLCALRLAVDPARGREIVEDWGIVPEAAER